MNFATCQSMSIGDLLIIYLAFGSPLAVYRYLETNGVRSSRRVAQALLALVFWIPVLARLGYRHLSNAYSGSIFVSQRNLDTASRRIVELREELRSELMRLGCDLPLYDLRDVLERYVGLAGVIGVGPKQVSVASPVLFEAAGRKDPKLGTACLMRRNRRRLEHHHIRARVDFLALFEKFSEANRAVTQGSFRLGVELARLLNDQEAVDVLETAAGPRGEVWNSDRPRLALSTASKVSPLTIQTVPSNNDSPIC